MWCIYMYICAVWLVAQLCPTLCDPMDCSPPDSSIHGDSPDKNTRVDCHALLQGIFPTQVSCIAGRLFTIWATREVHLCVCMYAYIYTVEYYSATKKNEIMRLVSTWVDLEIIVLSEVNQKETNTMWYHLYVESKVWHKWTYLWNRHILTDLEKRIVVAKGEGEWGRDRLGVWN